MNGENNFKLNETYDFWEKCDKFLISFLLLKLGIKTFISIKSLPDNERM